MNTLSKQLRDIAAGMEVAQYDIEDTGTLLQIADNIDSVHEEATHRIASLEKYVEAAKGDEGIHMRAKARLDEMERFQRVMKEFFGEEKGSK